MSELQTKPLKAVLDVMSCVTDEVTFISLPDGGTECKSADSSHTAMCLCTLEGTFPAPRMAFAIDELQRTLKTPTVGIELGDRVTVTSGHTVTRLRTIADDDSSLRMPSLTYDASATVQAPDLRALVRDADPKRVFYVRLTIDGDGVTLVADDEAGYGQTVTIPPEECLDISGSASTTLSLDYLKRFLSAVPNDAELRVEMSDDYPVRVSLTGEGWSAQWVCAPVILEE